jgi:7,8-dihydropterin-6-yl-methyl-4-(beta-D-ribofuranosyl)aminobenzene 5'-phosphate synthase
VISLGEVPRLTEYEDPGGPFFMDPQGEMPDLIIDDQALVVAVEGGLAVLCGCAHSGIVNILKRVEEVVQTKPLKMVMGGLHLKEASQERIEATVEELKARLAGRLVVGHCTGEKAMESLEEAFGPDLVPTASGLVLEA